jgi:hypothetical protein
MKRLFTLGLSLIILWQTFSFAVNEILKMGELMEHSQMHSLEYGDNFFTFLSKHYGSREKDHRTEHQEHDNLPFHQSIGMHLLVMYLYSPDNPEPSKQKVFRESLQHTLYKELHSSFEQVKIFQPPKTT